MARPPEPDSEPFAAAPQNACDVSGEATVEVIEKALPLSPPPPLSPSLPPPFFAGVPPARGEPLGDHDDQKGAAVEAPVGLPVLFLAAHGAQEEGSRGAEAPLLDAELVISPDGAFWPSFAAAAGGGDGRATAAAALRTQDRRKKRSAAATASTARPTPIQAPIDSEGLLLAEAVFVEVLEFFERDER